MISNLRAGIVGGSGYAGMELLRLLLHHPNAEVAWVTARQRVGEPVADSLPQLRGRTDLHFVAAEPMPPAPCDVVFYATGSGVAMHGAPALLEQDIRVIDLSADFRLTDAALWQSWYGEPHACKDKLTEAVYGLPELHREQIRKARLVANPGCYPTAVLLGLAPIVEAGLAETSSLIASAASGVTGAGRKATLALNAGETAESMRAYSACGHRHHPEINAVLESLAGGPVQLVFTPHLLPMARGLHATLYARLKQPRSLPELHALYAKRYADEPFVDLLASGAHPNTRHVRGTNRCQLAIHRPGEGDWLVVLAAEDNLVKGAAGQAIQNMNLMFDLPETAGLDLDIAL